jgi:ATP-dependent RNA helicase DeaD
MCLGDRFFSDLELSPEIMKGLRKLRFTELTPIQAQAIPLLMDGLDVMGQAQTGTGKTAAFGIPLVLKVDPEKHGIQGLVITPTRELAVQVSQMLGRFARYTGVSVTVVYGGEKIGRQMARLEGGIQVLVGTPGRLIDLMKRGVVDLRSVKVVVLDEADKMMEMGFIEDVGFILSKVPRVHQTSLWSATLSDDIMRIARRFMVRPVKLQVSKDEIAQTLVEQFYIRVEEEDKISELVKLLNDDSIVQALIFCNTRKTTGEVAQQLIDSGIDVVHLHGKMSQSKRDKVMDAFRRKHLKYIVATDVAARGLDISGVSHVYNFDVPEDSEIYFHRIGRTGRMEVKGTSITLLTDEDEPLFESIKAMTSIQITEMI